ncbi:transcriptional activator Myb-like protein [Carex littledalei]|uniref:Transcriptional activator Myb-like protein n=1 Tax=Carex littledalei TaxID=544730 RepID=A0A833RFD4_9POAL|nr:transcriptional activator Myb-like protein [Carex littledalei]
MNRHSSETILARIAQDSSVKNGEEDETIALMVQKHGPKKWSTIAEALPGRIGKQCCERIDNSIKNWWNCSLKKRINTYEKVPRDAESTGKKESQVISFSHSQGKMVNDGNSPELEIDTWLEDNPDKEIIPPDPGSGSKSTPIKEGATEQVWLLQVEFADTPGIDRGLESPSAWKSPCIFSENTSPVVAEAQEVVSASNKKSAAKRELARDENSRPSKQPRMEAVFLISPTAHLLSDW